MILMGKTDQSASAYKQQSMLLVPMDTPGIRLVRPLRLAPPPRRGMTDVPLKPQNTTLDS